METSSSEQPQKWQKRLGIGLSAVPILFLLFDSSGKIALVEPVKEGSLALGFPVTHMVGLGVLLLACTLLYALPRTALLGAVLLTGWLGGAIAVHVRVENPLFSHVLFPVYLAGFLWLGLVLREPRLRALLWRAPSIAS